MSGPQFTRIAKELAATVPFVAPEALERRSGRSLAVRLGANESAFGTSSVACQAMREAANHVAWYNDPEGYDLRAALAELHGVDLEEVNLGAGIDDLLGLMVRLLVEPGDAVVTSLGAYPTFNYHVVGFGGVLHQVPYVDDREDLQGLLERTREVRPKIVYVANPDNPMGTWHSAVDLEVFVAAVPPDCVIVLDEAYSDFAPSDALPAINIDEPRVARMRTFSKAHGMAGARVGYVLAHRDLARALDKVRNHFGVNRVAQAGALASLRDPGFVADVVREVAMGRQEYARLAPEFGMSIVDSATNFVAIDVGDGNRARALMAGLLEHDIFVRMAAVEPLDRCIRVTVGTADQRIAFANGLRSILSLPSWSCA